MNIVIPMAGKGTRTQELSSLPKPLILINNKPMIELAVKSLDIKGQYIFIVREYENEELNKNVIEILNNITTNPIIIKIDYVTEGPACSALLSKDYVNNDEELMIINADQVLKWDSSKFLNFLKNESLDGLVTTWDKIANTESFIKLDENGYGVRFAEKEIISNYPLNGIHYWRKGKYFIDSVEKMISQNRRSINNEFYISESYNIMIEDGFKIKNYMMGAGEHIPIGTKEDIEKFLKNK